MAVMQDHDHAGLEAIRRAARKTICVAGGVGVEMGLRRSRDGERRAPTKGHSTPEDFAKVIDLLKLPPGAVLHYF